MDECRSLKERAESCPELKACMDAITSKKKAKGAPVSNPATTTRPSPAKTWIDVRAFGQVFSFKKGGDAEGLSIGIRGPVTIQSAFSLAPVNIVSSQITKSVNLETGDDPDKKAADTMGMKHRVEFGVYKTFGSINVQTAQKTGFTEEDAMAIQEGAAHAFPQRCHLRPPGRQHGGRSACLVDAQLR